MIQLLTPLIGLASSFIQNKAEQGKAKQKAKLVQIESDSKIKEKIANGDLAWEAQQAQNSASSYKDEWFVILLSIPLIGAFIPGMVPYIKEGFIVLESMPDYYRAFLGAAIAASFGIKGLATFKK